jgi:hypothetical protein
MFYSIVVYTEWENSNKYGSLTADKIESNIEQAMDYYDKNKNAMPIVNMKFIKNT